MKTALVLGAGGFIGGHLVNRLKREGFWVRGVDIKQNEWQPVYTDHFILGDLRDKDTVKLAIDTKFNYIFQLAADMGGAGYVFTGRNDAEILMNSAQINLNVANQVSKTGVDKLFFSSSACVYPFNIQQKESYLKLREDLAYPAMPDSEYGWEKLFSERLYFALARNFNIDVRVARFHNIYGIYGSWRGGREKSIAALCRKIAEASDCDEIEIWGDGSQVRTYLYIDDCLDAVLKFVSQDNFAGPLNIGSEEMISINQLVDMISEIAKKSIVKKYIETAPIGVSTRTSDNTLIEKYLQWSPRISLREGVERTYKWIESQIKGEVKNV